MILGIYGAGGLGREVLVLAQEINAREHRWSEFFFIDDIQPDRMLKGVQVKGFTSINPGRLTDDIEIVIAIGEPAVRAVLAERVQASQGQLARLVHPNVRVPDCTRIGHGAVLCDGAFVSSDSVIGENAYLQSYAYIAHDCQIGEHSVISTYASFGGYCRVGTRTFIGMGALIRENSCIGDDVIIGMGSVVLKDVQDGVIITGNPATIMRKNDAKKVFK